MRPRLRQRETSGAKGAATGGDKTAPLTPMGRFKSLARRLSHVPRDELEEERKRYENQKRERGKREDRQ